MHDATLSPLWLHKIVRRAFVSLLLVWLLTGCSGLPASRSSPILPSAITLLPCTLANRAAECGTLAVFENRAAQTGRKINLNVAVIRARSTQPSPDPIFWLAGGPGWAATEDVAYAMQILGPANAERDLVFVDQRGTGGSNKLECPIPSDPARQVEDLRACLTNLGGDSRAYSTAWAMDDLDDVRAALGYDKINLYGESYGATAAQVYVLRHEEHVRTASLAGASLLDVPMFEWYPVSSQAAFEAMFARCEADATCHAAFPNLRQEFAKLLARLDQKPIATSLTDPRTGQPELFTREMLDTGIHSLLIRTDTTVMLPKAIHMVYSGDWKGLEDLISRFPGTGSSAPSWKAMNLTIVCHEGWAKLSPAETASPSTGSYLRYADVRAMTVPEDICGVVPRPETAALYGPAKDSIVPVLIVNGQVDPQDPPANVAGAKQRYPNSLALVAPGQAHGYTGASCRASIEADFVERGSVDGLQTDCLDQVALPAFVP